MDRRDDGRAARVHPCRQLLDPAGRALLGRLDRGIAQGRELADVGAGDERLLALAAKHDRARLVGAVEPVVLLLELLEQARGERVHGRVVERRSRPSCSTFTNSAICLLYLGPMRKAPSRRITSPFR